MVQVEILTVVDNVVKRIFHNSQIFQWDSLNFAFLLKADRKFVFKDHKRDK
ncbi:MAG: hypothetical protein RLZZ71_931 [Bacteroidota bacterium]|jgi:hypothetical protein